MPPLIFEYLSSLISLVLVITVAGCIHVLLYKRDSRSALAWVGMIILFPLAGAALYVLFGINRVQRKARRVSLRVPPEGGTRSPGFRSADGAALEYPGYNVTGNGFSTGNRVTTFHNGEQAFPPMLQAIHDAQHEVLLSTYIFDNDATGRQFVAALAAARQRGVRVYVLVDDAGIRYSFPTIIRALKKHKLEFRRFMPLRLFPPSLSINLRTHRKLLITDRSLSFAGGMNIGDRQLANGPSRHRATDLHFQFEGPITVSFVELFEDDWIYAGGKALSPPESSWSKTGAARCRIIPDGPDETLDSLALVLNGIIATAKRRVWIMTPYFLPDQKMTGCLQSAALSGVDVTVIIPQKNNWPVVQWALQHRMAELLETGVTIMQRPGLFAHSKCMIIDDTYCMTGSANLDPRSLRLNFELGIEIIDPTLNAELAAHFEQVADIGEPFTQEQLRQRNTLIRLRDAAAALFTPYL